MSACLAVAGARLILAAATFTLSWEHSVERVEWREAWRVTPAGLVLTEARVRGSGAGMEPADGARLDDGWWVWNPGPKPLARLVLASSGATQGGWTLCHDGNCRQIGSAAGRPVVIEPCGRGTN